jgi:hypothetical protein
MVMKVTKDLLLQVREMMERKWDCIEIANRLNIDADDVRMMIELINNILT